MGYKLKLYFVSQCPQIIGQRLSWFMSVGGLGRGLAFLLLGGLSKVSALTRSVTRVYISLCVVCDFVLDNTQRCFDFTLKFYKMKYALYEFIEERSCEIGESRWIVKENEDSFNNNNWISNKVVLVKWPTEFSSKKIIKSTIDPEVVETTTFAAKVIKFGSK